MEMAVRAWPVQDAKAPFSEMLETCLKEGPQVVTRPGAEAAVLVPVAEWRGVLRQAGPTLKELLLSDEPLGDLIAPARDTRRRREAARLV